MSLNLFKTLSDLSGTYSSARNHRSRLSPGGKRRPARRRIVLETLEDRTLLSVWVATDQTDYPPGSTALISGGGYQPGDAITLQVVHTDGNPDVSPANDPWTVTADDSGNVASTWYVDPDSSAGDSLELTASDPATGDQAVADFTDSNPPSTSLFAVTPSPTSVPPTIAARFTGNSSPTNLRVYGAEYFVDTTGANGTGIAFTGITVATTVNVSQAMDSTIFNGLSEGTHTVYVHSRNNVPTWSALTSTTFVKLLTPVVTSLTVSPSPDNTPPTITATITSTHGLTAAEYFVDTAVTAGTGMTLGNEWQWSIQCHRNCRRLC